MAPTGRVLATLVTASAQLFGGAQASAISVEDLVKAAVPGYSSRLQLTSSGRDGGETDVDERDGAEARLLQKDDNNGGKGDGGDDKPQNKRMGRLGKAVGLGGGAIGKLLWTLAFFMCATGGIVGALYIAFCKSREQD